MAKKAKAKSKKNAPPSVLRFSQAVSALSYVGKGDNCPLNHMTFWVGAGFSKAWNPAAPTTAELFAIPEKIADAALPDGVQHFLGLDFPRDLSLEDIRRAVYLLDMYEKYPDVRGRYFDGQNLRMVRKSLRNMIVENYGRLCPIQYMDSDSYKFPDTHPSNVQKKIARFFHYLQRQSSGTGVGGGAEGLRVHFVTTNYDFTIEEILDSHLGSDDAIFNYVYRGFTPHHVAGWDNPSIVHDNWLVHHILKLNGGFEVYREQDGGYHLNYGERKNYDRFSEEPTILLPSREQDYSDPYFQEIFPKAVRLLRDSKILVIIGYSLPEDDALIRFILRQFSEDLEDGVGKLVFYIDPMADSLKRERLEQVFSEQTNLKFHFYQGRFDRFVSAFLKMVATA